MEIQRVVKEVTVRGQVQGMDQVARAYDQVAASSEKSADGMSKSAEEAAGAEAAINRLGRQLQDNYQQQQRFNDMVAQQARASQLTVAANDNSAKSFSVLGIEAAEAANHLRVAAEAAYVFSPAFREVVNGLAAPALSFAARALTGTAAGIVLATNVAGKGLIEVGLAAARSSTALAPIGAHVAQAGAAMAAFNPTVTSVATSILGRFLPAVMRFVPIIGQLLLLKDAIMLVMEAWELGGKKLEEYRQIAEKAAAVDLSASFFQRITKAATDAKLPVDELTQSLKKLAEVSAEKLGGSELQNHLDKLTKAGNFQGNTGVQQLAQANTTEQRFRAIVELTNQAFAKGERLAALDLTSKFLSPAAQAALTADSEYLNRMLAAADSISQKKLVSDQDIGRALDLQNRYDAAVKILEQRWHPVQDLLTQGGIEMRAVWVGIVETIARAVDWAARLIGKLGDLPDLAKKGYFSALSASAPMAASVMAPPLAPLILAGSAAHGVYSSVASKPPVEETNEYTQALGKLRAGLQDTNAVQRAVAETNAVQGAVWKDTSKKIDDTAKKVSEAKDQYDRAKDSIEKHTARMMSDKDAVGLGAAALEEGRARATLWTAALQAGIPVVGKTAQEIDRLAKEAGAAAEALERARGASQIDWANKTKFLSSDDIAIAQQLRGIYGNDVPRALASTEAAQLRVINATRDLSDGFRDVGRSIVNAFLTGKDMTSAMISALDKLANKLADSGFDNFLSGVVSGNPLQAGIGAAQMGVSWLITQFTGDQKAKQELEKAKAEWAGMTTQIREFNLAAQGVDLGPLTNELNSLYSSASQLIQAAIKAQDQAGAARAAAQFNNAVVRIVDEFIAGSEKLTPLQQTMKEVNDEATGLAATLRDLGYAGRADMVLGALPDRIADLLADYREGLVKGLQQRINDAEGKSYLNDAAALIKQHQQDLSDAAILGNDPALLGQIAAAFAAQAQKIIDDAGLVGDEFADFTELFPDLAGAVHEAAVDISGSIANIKKYLESLQVGSNSILSPEQQLKLAQENFNRQLGLAQGGDSEALGTITQYAQTLIDQAKSFYASSAGYADIFRAVTGALGGLSGGVSSFSSINVGSSSAASLGAAGSVLPGLTSIAPAAATNDNGQHFTQQTQTLVQAQGAAATAIVAAIEDLRSDMGRLIAAVTDGNKKKALRPSSREAA